MAKCLPPHVVETALAMTATTTTTTTSIMPKTGFDENYELTGQVLGHGASGDVMEGRCRSTGRSVAVKQFAVRGLTQKQVSNLIREVDIHSSVDHPHIVKLEAAFESSQHVELVMEKVCGCELFDKTQEIGPFSDEQAAKTLAQVLATAGYLHARGFVHRDIKLENIMLDGVSGNIKMIDFGFASRCRRGEKLWQVCGSLQYIAPEVLQRTGYDQKADIWSVGAIAFMLLTNTVLFPGEEKDVFRKNREGCVDWSAAAHLSPGARQFLQRLLNLDPSERPTALQALQDPWLQRWAHQEVAVALESLKAQVILMLPRAKLSLAGVGAASAPSQDASLVTTARCFASEAWAVATSKDSCLDVLYQPRSARSGASWLRGLARLALGLLPFGNAAMLCDGIAGRSS